ncbi:MAG TPA: hypothetical protein PKW35_20020 [Nannocystaceae bacterium]|nr:hypothetical protein [Nannocystaceae bacterium]
MHAVERSRRRRAERRQDRVEREHADELRLATWGGHPLHRWLLARPRLSLALLSLSILAGILLALLGR